ncbi:protein-tyrosine-phosphatase [Novosphingobium sediminis]|uniref:Protein-tyrosine-phosphatase n=1 Tax=Novosphingobium sediminis TaxID=707214 RepID=A0A512AJX5_9SPHN|nr:tyrosine-protein phosphatase [Novosphingobium sediminis]GEN99994.1 protein-tyrosine-phosphatase [Novosphingobium sediminis]
MENRVLPLSGIHNFRDYGGYRARGGTLRTGHLWRSGHHFDATPDDLEAVHRIGIARVIDLRGDSERAQFPCLRHEEWAGQVVFHPGETAGDHGKAVHDEAAAGVRTADDARYAMVKLYDKLPFRPVLVGTFKLYLQTLAADHGPSLLHCFAGKDRTGVGAAIVHRLLGVHADDVMADYLLTNTAGNSEARIAAAATNVRASFGPKMTDDALRTIMSVQPEFLDSAFAAMEREHGRFEAYAEAVLGADAALVARLEERLVV